MASSTPSGRRRRAAAPDLPLGSLSRPRPDAPGPRACPSCGSTSLTVVSVGTELAVPAVFASCHDCEVSGWYAQDDGRDITAELALGTGERAAPAGPRASGTEPGQDQ